MLFEAFLHSHRFQDIFNNKGQEKPTEQNEVATACDLQYDFHNTSWSD